MRRHLEALVDSLPARGIEVASAVPSFVVLPEAAHRFPVEIGDRPRPAHDLAAVLRLRSAAAAFRPEVVHAHGIKAALLALTALPFGRPPVVVTLHNLWRRGSPLAPLARKLLPRAAAIVAVSEAVSTSFHAVLPAATPSELIPHGLDLAESPAQPWGDETRGTAFVGRLTEEKGVPVLLEASRLLSTAALPLTIAGDGPLRPEVEAEAQGGPAVRYVGYVQDPRGLYCAAALVVVPSLSEGLGLTALEAMASARPVVASDVGGLPEVLGHGDAGILVPPGDAAALAAAIGRLAADPQAARILGERGRTRVEAHYSREVMLDRLMGVYAGAAAGLGLDRNR